MKLRLLLHRAVLLGILFGCLIWCVACSTKPFVIEVAGKPATAKKAEKPPLKITSLGFSILTKSKHETAYVELPDGTKMSSTVSGKNEVSVPNTYLNWQGAEALANIAAGVTNTATAARVSETGIAADVSKAKIDADKTVKLLKLAPE